MTTRTQRADALERRADEVDAENLSGRRLQRFRPLSNWWNSNTNRPGQLAEMGKPMNKATKKVALGSAVVLMFGLAACGDDDDASGDGGTGASVSVVTTDEDDASEDGGTDASVSVVTTDEDDASEDGGTGASVSVVMTDGHLELDLTSVDAGIVEFVAKNEGGDLHNLLIVKGDDPAALPLDQDGAVIEDDLPEGDFIGKIAVVHAGTEESASFDLDSGSYIIFCNTVSIPIAHFQDMVTTLTVN